MSIKTSIVSAIFLAIFCNHALAGRGVQDSYQSAALGRKVNFTVYLPDDYAKMTRKFPAVYLLHGLGGAENEWLENGALKAVDIMVKQRSLSPMLAIMPSFGAQSWWIDGATDKAETALMQELIPYVESKYKVDSGRAARSVAGWSMGAYGALNLALKYPDRFCAAAVIAPEIYDPLPSESSAIRRMPQFMRNGAFDPAGWEALNYPAHLDSYRKHSIRVPIWVVTGDDDQLLGLVSMAAQLYARLSAIQLGQTELRIIDGELDWSTVRRALPDALRYINRKCGSK